MSDNPIRVLQIIRSMNQGGAENFIMNVYRNINKNKIQFDFLVYKKNGGKNFLWKVYYRNWTTKIL